MNATISNYCAYRQSHGRGHDGDPGCENNFKDFFPQKWKSNVN